MLFYLFLGSDRVCVPDRGSSFGICCSLLSLLGFGSSNTELDRVIYYIGIIYDGTGLGTVMVGVLFPSDCSPLFLII